MPKINITKRGVAKFVAHHITWEALDIGFTAGINSQLDDDQTENYEVPVDVVSFLGSWYVAAKLRPLTDGAVDRVADWHHARKVKKIEDLAAESALVN